MEFVLIEYPERRRVRRNKALFGLTRTVTECRAGVQTFDLATPKDYTPLEQRVDVRNTSATSPMKIEFQPLTGAFITLQPPPPPPPPAASRTLKAGRRKGAARKPKGGKKKSGKKASKKKGAAKKTKPRRRR